MTAMCDHPDRDAQQPAGERLLEDGGMPQLPPPPALPLPRRRMAAFLTLLLAALTTPGCSLLGREFPFTDPAVIYQRLTDRAQWAYDSMALPPHEPVNPVHVQPASRCYTGIVLGSVPPNLLPDVTTFELDWKVKDIPADVARTAESRLRREFLAAGWTLTNDSNRQDSGGTIQLGFRVEDPETGDKFDLRWVRTTSYFSLSGHTACTKVPESATHDPSPNPWSPQIE